MLHLSALRDAQADMQKRLSEGAHPDEVSIDDYDIPPAPLKFTVMKWRQKMHVGYAEAMTTPFEVIAQDLEMLNYEAEFGPVRAIIGSEQG